MSQLIFEVVQNLSWRQNDAFHRWLQALQGLFRQCGQQLVFSNFALIAHMTQLRCAGSTAKNIPALLASILPELSPEMAEKPAGIRAVQRFR